MAKRPNLASNMYRAANPTLEVEQPAVPETVQMEASPSTGRRNKRAITFYVEPEVFKQFRMLTVEEDSNGDEMMHEALNELFRKYNKPAIALK